ncbi:MAG: hypothetical protein HC782_00810 [Gammaproteobacteria bacterium]|nr:hypothetical protein [Gammaproteobacteria bacterium]
MSLWLMLAAGLISVALLTGFILLRLNRKWAAILTISICMVIGIEIIERGYEKISPLQSGYAAANNIRPHLTTQTRLYTVKTYDQSLPFYLERIFTMVDYTDEFSHGSNAASQKNI